MTTSSTRAYIRFKDTTLDVVAITMAFGYKIAIVRYPDPSGNILYRGVYAPTEYGLTGAYDTPQQVLTAVGRYLKKSDIDYLDIRRDAVLELHSPDSNPEDGFCSEHWTHRERNRFLEGDYTPIPDLGITFPEKHYVHLSVAHPGTDMVAYTPNDEYGQRDRQISLKFGKYLRKTFPDMSDSEIQKAVTKLRVKLKLDVVDVKLHFATDKDTINDIFETEMYACGSDSSSCMFGKFDGSRHRPYHVYADSPDVAVAYLTDNSGDIIARSVVSTKDKVWIRPYSVQSESNETECELLTNALEAAGYTKGSLIGNRLTKLDTCEVMLPYIDCGGQYVRDAGNYWKVCHSHEADYQACNTGGTAEECFERCGECCCREEDCECSTCDCCGRRSEHGCQRCIFCDDCGVCLEHTGCDCAEEEWEEEEEEEEEEEQVDAAHG